jgi:hypothetical protein
MPKSKPPKSPKNKMFSKGTYQTLANFIMR